MAAFSKAVLFYNEKAGHTGTGHPRQVIESHFSEHDINLKIVEIPLPPDEIQQIVSQAIDDGTELFIAAGGDGTVSLVGSALIDRNIPVGIIPLGTGNILAKELKIPLKIKKALDLITGTDHHLVSMDTFTDGNRTYILNFSAGVIPKVMASTASEEKQRLGIFAYIFNSIQQLLGLKLQRFSLEFDQQKVTHNASEILITNSRSVGAEPLKWSEDVFVDDGILNILVLRAKSIFDLFGMLITFLMGKEKKNHGIKMYQFSHYCHIEAQYPVRTQADGDAVGETPVHLKVNPASLTVIASTDGNYQKS